MNLNLNLNLNATLLRVLANTTPDVLASLFSGGSEVTADVVSVFRDRAILSLGQGVRLEVTLQANLKEGDRVKLKAEPRPPGAPADPLVLKVVGTAARPGAVRAQPLEGQAPQGLARHEPAPAVAAKPEAPGAQPAVPAAESATTKLDVDHAAIDRANADRAAADRTNADRIAADLPRPMVLSRPGEPQAPPAPIQWLQIPLPSGGHGWAQIHIDDEETAHTSGDQAKAVCQVRIWWETPGTGPIQVTLDSVGKALTALFTVPHGDVREAVEQRFPDLRAALLAAGFDESRLMARPPAPGESVAPHRPDEGSLLNRKL